MNQTARAGDTTFGKSGQAILANQTAGYHHGITRAGPRLGSMKSRQLNFARDHTFYHGEAVVDPRVKSAVRDMRNLTDRDLLGKKKAEWN